MKKFKWEDQKKQSWLNFYNWLKKNHPIAFNYIWELSKSDKIRIRFNLDRAKVQSGNHLKYLFIWAYTPQGWAFWDKIFKENRKQLSSGKIIEESYRETGE